jgi:hypothetical protein
MLTFQIKQGIFNMEPVIIIDNQHIMINWVGLIFRK